MTPGSGRRRDRRGHGPRGPLLPASLPAARTRSQRFDALVLEAVARLEPRWGEALAQVDLAVELVPPSDPSPWEEDVAPLGRVFPAEADRRARLVVYRRPVEARADEDLPRLVHEVVVEQVATLLSRSPEDIDPSVADD
ncbi:metallopeptidase family protein [Jannaschia sp. R86511]|uniref:metallopeptidase family protein n=1 Tax=Jannaschia sp. R86511 TaxID=3093853 RepID=UPI0036D3C2CD